MNDIIKNDIGQNIAPEFSSNEKVIIMTETFGYEKFAKKDKIFIENIGDYLATNFKKIDGFDYRWNSLITSQPLLFEDMDYLRCRQHINNTITEKEIEAYRSGKLRELYATFENMLICNLQYYDRIMSYCTMVFLHYVRLSEDTTTSQNLAEIPYVFEMTPTQVWCAALTNTSSSEWEINYGWKQNIKDLKLKHDNNKSLIEVNWNLMYNINTFAKFVEYSALRCSSVGFRETLISDKTSNRRLAQVCAKFTRTSTAINSDQLNSIIDYVEEQESINNKLFVVLNAALMKMFSNDDKQFAVYVFNTEFYIHTTKFSMRVKRTKDDKITKDYLANSYECFVAEIGLVDTIKTQIEWSKYVLPFQFQYDKDVLTNLLTQMLKENYKDIVCVKRMNEFGILVKVHFSGVFGNVYIHERYMIDNRCIKEDSVCLSKENAAKYVINKGYYVFGTETDIFNFEQLTKSNFINHYSNYCIPVIQHMSEIISLHNLSKNDIIDVVCSGKLNPNKIMNHNIKYTKSKSLMNPKKIMNSISTINKITSKNAEKSYWKVIEE